jgi:hypothetical protein
VTYAASKYILKRRNHISLIEARLKLLQQGFRPYSDLIMDMSVNAHTAGVHRK